MNHAPCEHCGGFPTPRKGQPRSVPQHKRFFALIKAAHFHWPETHKFQPVSEDHLRKWLTAKAGHRTVQTIETAGMQTEQMVAAIAAQVTRAGPWAVNVSAGTRFYSIIPDSIDFDTLPHMKACALFDAVSEIIEVETGIRCDDMIKTAPRKTRAFQAEAVA